MKIALAATAVALGIAYYCPIKTALGFDTRDCNQCRAEIIDATGNGFTVTFRKGQ